MLCAKPIWMPCLLRDIKRGYTFSSQLRRYTCLECGAVFEAGRSIPLAHGCWRPSGRSGSMSKEPWPAAGPTAGGDSRYLALTDTQKKLLTLFAAGLPDSEVARRTGVSPSTVRHQRFSFREKAKQANLPGGLRPGVGGEPPPDSEGLRQQKRGRSGSCPELVPVQPGAKAVDDRYRTTLPSGRRCCKTAFTPWSPSS